MGVKRVVEGPRTHPGHEVKPVNGGLEGLWVNLKIP